MSEAMKGAWISWDHHDGGDARDDDSWSIREMMKAAFQGGWDLAGGEQRLAAIDRAQQLMHECICSDTDKPSGYCIRCQPLLELRKIMGDEVEE